jgi:hypothetical protein
MCVMSAPGFPTAGHMAIETWGLLLESCLRDEAVIQWVHWHGEPFLWRHFNEGIRLWKESGLSGHGMIATNAQAVTEEQMDLLAGSGIRGVRVGLDSTDPRIYAQHRTGGDFDSAIANIRRFIAVRPALRVEVLLMLSTVNRDADAEGLYRLVGRPDNLFVLNEWCYSTGGDPGLTFRKNPAPDPRACSMLEKACMVTFDGRVGLCCWDALCENLLGRFPDEPSIRRIYYGRYAEDMRARIRRGDYSLSPACRTCSMDPEFRAGAAGV